MSECALSQGALADLMGVKPDRVKSLANARATKFTREESEALVKKLHIRAEWLVTGEGPMFQTPAERQFQRRLDAVAMASQQAAAAKLKPEQADLLQRILLAAQSADAATLQALLHPLTGQLAVTEPGGEYLVGSLRPDELALLDNYRHCPPDAQATLRATGALFAQQKAENVKPKKGRQ